LKFVQLHSHLHRSYSSAAFIISHFLMPASASFSTRRHEVFHSTRRHEVFQTGSSKSKSSSTPCLYYCSRVRKGERFTCQQAAILR